MKNVFKLSLVALLVSLPAVAFAEIPEAFSMNYVGEPATPAGYPAVTPSDDLATTSYVQGAYNALVGGVNSLGQRINMNDISIDALTTSASEMGLDLQNLGYDVDELKGVVDAMEIPDTGTGTVNVVKSWGGSAEEMNVTVDLNKTTTSGSGTQEENE